MKSKYVNGTINKGIYIHNDANTISRINTLETKVTEIQSSISSAETNIESLSENKQDKLIAGENIIIEDNVISATGGGSTGSFIVLDSDIPIEAGQDVQIPVANELCQTPVLWSSVVVNDGTEEVELVPDFDSQTHTYAWHDDNNTILIYTEAGGEDVYIYSENDGDYHLLIKFDNTMPTYIDVSDAEVVSIRPIDVGVAIQFGKQIVGFVRDDYDQTVETGYITEMKQNDYGDYIIKCLGQLYQTESLTSYFYPISKPDDTSSVTFWLTQSAPKSVKGMQPDDYWYLEEGYNLQSIVDAWNEGNGDVYLAYEHIRTVYKYRVTTVSAGITRLLMNTMILAECVNNIDIDKNTVELKYIKAEGAPTQTGVEFRVITKTVNEVAQDSNTFVVFDGDLTFEEYFDPDNDVTIGRIVNPPEFDEIENGDARSTSHCPSLYDYVEIDGEPLVKARNSPLWYSSDDESFVSIGNEDGIAEDVYLEIRANSAGTHHVKILASYGGTAYVGYGGASITAYLNLTPRDVKIAYRTLKKVILAFQPLGGGPSTNYSTLSHFNELEDLNEEELYVIECGGFAYFAKYLRNFKSDSSLRTTRIDATIVNYFETSDTSPEDSVISSSISPDQLISAINSGMMVNISFVRSFGDSTTTDIVPSIYYQITKNEAYGIYTIELQPPHNYSGVALHGITTNNLFDKSNEWYHTINPLNINDK